MDINMSTLQLPIGKINLYIVIIATILLISIWYYSKTSKSKNKSKTK